MRTYSYRGFVIEPKRDFGSHGFFIKGKYVKKGWVVCYGPGRRYEGCNALPGGTWTQTLREARECVDAFIKARGNAVRFWKIVHADLEDTTDLKPLARKYAATVKEA